MDWDAVISFLEQVEVITSSVLALVSFLGGWFGKLARDKRRRSLDEQAETVHLNR